MELPKIPKRISTAVLNSVVSGVTPRVGLEYIAVGRKNEINSLLDDLDNIAGGGSAFRFIVGRYGSGKSFMLQIIRNYALDRNYIVCDADLSPERKLMGGKGQGLATYRQLVRNMSSKVRPDGGALMPIIDKWLIMLRGEVIAQQGINEEHPMFVDTVQSAISSKLSGLDSMVFGYDFIKLLSIYWVATATSDDNKKAACMKWLKGEYSTKTEARAETGVNSIIDDENWYEYIKLLSSFAVKTGYLGFLVLIDEGVNLYKISNTISRNANYEKILTMFNDTMQGRVENLGIYLCGTPQFIEDARRGIYSYDALKSRISQSAMIKNHHDYKGPVIFLERLSHEELFLLIQKIQTLHSVHYGYTPKLGQDELVAFMKIAAGRLGADELLTPREIIRDFCSVLNVMHQDQSANFYDILGKNAFTEHDIKVGHDEDPEDDAFEMEL